MARWEPGAAQRLQRAALELFVERGFEQVTAAEVAAAAGLSERTFFRHFADKREVLFAGQEAFAEPFLAVVAAADPALARSAPMAVAAAAVRSGAGSALFSAERRPWSRARQGVVDAHPQLRERERHKLAVLADDLGGALRGAGAPEVAAALAAQSAVTAFGVAFALWLRDGEERPLVGVLDAVLEELAAVTAAAAPA